MIDIRDVPCAACVQGYRKPHTCDSPGYCPCDDTTSHLRPNAEIDATVTVSLEDLRAVLLAADYTTNPSLIGPVDRLGDAVALATLRRGTEQEFRVSQPQKPR